MRIRLRGPSGASTISLDGDATVRDLRSSITASTSLVNFDVKYGYPPNPLRIEEGDVRLDALGIKLDGEQLTISPRDGPLPSNNDGSVQAIPAVDRPSYTSKLPPASRAKDDGTFSFPGIEKSELGKDPAFSTSTRSQQAGPVPLQRKGLGDDVPELPMPERGATLVMRVMPDDNSCLFRAFGTAVLPGDDLSMTELRALVASTIQMESDTYTAVVLDQKPDDYCRWIQTEEAWGGAIELGILSKHFDIEICSIDVQSLRIDRFNEGAPRRCILVYSGIHYDTIVQSPSNPPHTVADAPPELDMRVWDSDNDDILFRAKELCQKLQAKHYYTDTGGMGIRCNICGWIGHGEKQAAAHATQTGHYDMMEMS